MKHLYYYTFDHEWDEDFLNEAYSESDCLYEVAEEVCEENDHFYGEYPDSRSLWIMREGQTTPICITVKAETIRKYMAVAIRD